MASTKPPLLTVCEALSHLKLYNGKSVVLVGKFVTTIEGQWLVENCEHKLITKVIRGVVRFRSPTCAAK